MVPLTDDLKHFVVNLHNEYRNLAAHGVNQLPPAGKMLEMVSPHINVISKCCEKCVPETLSRVMSVEKKREKSVTCRWTTILLMPFLHRATSFMNKTK